MKCDLIGTEIIHSSFFSCPQDIRKLLELLFVKSGSFSNKLKRLLIINSPDCLSPEKDAEYNAIVEKYTLKDLIDKQYIRLNPKISRGTHQEIKSYIIISLDNFSQNKKSAEYRDYLIHIHVVCYNDAWTLDGFDIRPLAIVGYIDGILNSLSDKTTKKEKSLKPVTKLTGIGRYDFVACNLVVLNEDLSMYSLSYLGVHFTEDVGKMQVSGQT